MNMKRAPLMIYGVFVAGVLLLAILGVEAGFRISSAQGRERITIGVVVTVIALLAAGGTIFGLLARSISRNKLLQSRFPQALVVTVRKTSDLATKLLILNGATTTGGVAPDALGYYSSLVIDSSGAALWTGGAANLTGAFAVTPDKIREVAVSQTSAGQVMNLTVLKGSVPVSLLFPLVRLGRFGFFPVREAEVERLVQAARVRLGL